ncbi:MAG TPA: hypothetical protein VK814_01590 [Acidobacteriaceae bacterium]|jgi:hypothetical protein|nr:hypothetical protein [Acidobacteriaceae bacterium]
MSDLEAFRQTLLKIIETVEDLAIENEVYYDAILESRNINLPQLKRDVDAAKTNPEKRAEVRQCYAEARQGISDAGIRAYAAHLFAALPKPEKLN